MKKLTSFIVLSLILLSSVMSYASEDKIFTLPKDANVDYYAHDVWEDSLEERVFIKTDLPWLSIMIVARISNDPNVEMEQVIYLLDNRYDNYERSRIIMYSHFKNYGVITSYFDRAYAAGTLNLEKVPDWTEIRNGNLAMNSKLMAEIAINIIERERLIKNRLY